MSNDVFSIGVSGLRAAENTVVMAASNIVNVRSGVGTPRREGDYTGYTPVEPVASSVSGGGVVVGSRPVTPAYLEVPSANGGTEQMPNIDLGTESMRMIVAETSYKASAALIRTADEMSKRLIDTVG